MGQKIFVVDAFTARPFAGNPAAVCVLERECSEAWMRALAREMNLSETAFLLPRGEGFFQLRWFTPTLEVDLCGHATLAGAHVLWEDGRVPPEDAVRFETRSGRLTAVRRDGRIELDFPASPPAALPDDSVPDALRSALGAEPVWIGRSGADYLLELESAEAVRSLRPDLVALADVEARGIIVTAHSDDADADFVSRFFGPAVGVPEDPVTGSAHCALAPFWAEKLGRTELTGFQASARGGYVGVRLAADRVALIGDAVTVLRGELAAAASADRTAGPSSLFAS
jgi:PhzF family phenazine biosynthesis protein